jgi:ABC-type multidrug transport system fused ATPase/permease subunit
VLALLGPLWRYLPVAIGCGILGEALVVASGALAAYLVGLAITGATADELVAYLLSLVALVPLFAALPAAQDYYAHKMAFLCHDDIRRKLFDAFERLAPAYFVRRRSGDVAAAATADVELIELYTSHYLPQRVLVSVIPTLAVIGMLFIHPLLALVLAPFPLLIVTVPSWLRARSLAQGTEIVARSGELSADLVDAVQGMREVVAFGAQDFELARIEANAVKLGRARVADGRRGGLEKAVSEGLVSVGLLAVVGSAACLVHRGWLEPAHYPPVIILAAAAFVPVTQLVGVGRELNQVAAAADRITAILDEPPTVEDRPGAAPVPGVRPEVSFEHVSFRYAPELPDALSDVSFRVSCGETVALVGASGAGKSTCANLLLRLWDPTSGRITIGGHDLRDLPQEQLRDIIAYVPQDTYLFNASVRDNLRLGREDVSDDDLRHAADVALASEFVDALPQGWDTTLGERGARLSGGQRQRIAVARAILADAPILVMDEAVSNLDAESEIAMRRAIALTRRGRTLLIVAHRPSTIRSADRVITLAGGQIVADQQ